MRVGIVGKTHMGGAACIGGIAVDDGTSLRLLTSDGFNHSAQSAFEVGQVWELEFARAQNPRPPHLEDVLVTKQQLISSEHDLRNVILGFESPWRGRPHSLFDGLIRATANGSGYISEAVGLPRRSTGYWIADADLTQDGDARRYLYPSPIGVRRLTYVGFAPMVRSIAAGTLLRVSLARWWRPEDADGDLEERCYLQLSGWFS